MRTFCLIYLYVDLNYSKLEKKKEIGIIGQSMIGRMICLLRCLLFFNIHRHGEDTRYIIDFSFCVVQKIGRKVTMKSAL